MRPLGKRVACVAGVACVAAMATLSVACGGSTGETIVDGARVSPDGWPVRPADEQVRCPEGTSISDEIVGARRRVTCRTRLNPTPRGFELVWHANGQLATRRTLDDDARPKQVVHYDEAGRKVAEESWEDGTRMVSKAWYPTGAPRAEEVWVPDAQATQITKWAPDGSIEAKGMIADGDRVGLWTEWVDGAVERAEYVGGVRAGNVTRTYADGSVETGAYVDGKRDGRWRKRDSSGSPMREERYDDGVLDGPSRSWHPNQQPRAEGTYVRGNKHGQWTYWHPSGEVAARESYSCGVLHGLLRRFHPNGQLELEGVFWNGQRIGEWRTRSPSGVLMKVDDYDVPEGIEDLDGLRSGSRLPALPKTCSAPPEGSS